MKVKYKGGKIVFDLVGVWSHTADSRTTCFAQIVLIGVNNKTSKHEKEKDLLKKDIY